MKFEDLTPEQQEKARACKTAEDLLALIQEEDYELSEEELGQITGAGGLDHWITCPNDCQYYQTRGTLA